MLTSTANLSILRRLPWRCSGGYENNVTTETCFCLSDLPSANPTAELAVGQGHLLAADRTIRGTNTISVPTIHVDQCSWSEVATNLR